MWVSYVRIIDSRNQCKLDFEDILLNWDVLYYENSSRNVWTGLVGFSVINEKEFGIKKLKLVVPHPITDVCTCQNYPHYGTREPVPDWQVAKCQLYMDDVTVFYTDQSSVTALIQTYKESSQASETKVKCGKLEAMLFLELALAPTNLLPFSIQPDFIKISRVWVRKEGVSW